MDDTSQFTIYNITKNLPTVRIHYFTVRTINSYCLLLARLNEHKKQIWQRADLRDWQVISTSQVNNEEEKSVGKDKVRKVSLPLFLVLCLALVGKKRRFSTTTCQYCMRYGSSSNLAFLL